ncbi:Suppressor of lurcher protein [Echinococcus granulosus]|uniref:Suppressor of lurcher protein n=1 Tax=Echinococcus granulosus TaxID=6210 RepID=W6UGJ9_ECHGR|nr:Suppressor of lurcher protein [Echinococcus granulosus]EUB60101.1 Suppressor of lurcher protein [Echinococcus granulosus]
MMRRLGTEDKLITFTLLIACSQSSLGLRSPPSMDPLVVIQNPNCRCHLFSSVKRLHGVFKSPNFPSPYPPQTDCIIYLFQGLPFQIVQLTFLTLDLSPPRIDICFDYVAVLHNDRTRLVDREVADSDPPPVLCGTLTMQKKRTFFSESNSLALVFHSTTRAPFEQSTHMSGFQGNFLFLNSTTCCSSNNENLFMNRWRNINATRFGLLND